MSLTLKRTVLHPVLMIESEVRYRTLRRPTVIEKMVLRLILAASGDARLAERGLASVFEQELGLLDAARLIEPAVRDLHDVNLLHPPAPLHGLSLAECQTLLDEPLDRWQLDARAEDCLRRGWIPRRAQTCTVHHVFDPISREMRLDDSIARGPVRSNTTAPPWLPIPEVTAEDLSGQVRARLPEEKHDWRTVDTEILDIRCATPHRDGRPVQLEITVAPDGTVTARAPQSASVQRWLGQTEPESLWPLLAGLLSTPTGSGSPGAVVSPDELASLDRVGPAREPKPRQLDLPAQDAGNGLEVIEWLNDRSSRLPIARPAALPASWTSMRIQAPGKPPEISLAGAMRLHWAGHPRTIPVQGWMNPQTPQAVELVTRLTQAIGHALAGMAAPAAEVMRLWFEPPSQVLAAWARHADGLDDAARMNSLAQLLQEMARRQPPEQIAAEPNFGPQLQALLSRRSPIDDETGRQRHLAGTLALLQAVRSWPESLHAQIAQRVVDALPPLRQLAEARALRKALGNDTLTLPATLLSPSLREDLLEAALDEQPSGCGPHLLSRPIQQFITHWKQLRRDIDPVLLDTRPDLDSPAPEWRRAVIRRVARLEAAVQDGRRHIETLSQHLGQVPAQLQPLDARLYAIADWLEQHLAPALPRNEPVRVLDTSVLMEAPQLLDRVPGTIRLVLPRRVIQELDGLKRTRPDEDDANRSRQAAQARAAIAAIERHQARLTHEPDHPELWPEQAMSSDECILSAAIFWARSEVRLWSTDRNLRNLAQSCGIGAEEAPRFGPAARPRTSEKRP
ncbi:PIN domain-containing protein [Sphaerotilus uruguayifluvii]|uniref:rRNA-processing protein FCF1 n=1 Tax=Sphaerotilus uruguayifluvii TaxID=2735897 RepID=A0ABX2G6X6_9BURK|nr:PIN domain-containing protein [Leptothrix sp. C29]NRT58067.1 rRNA-processing protein FCF1 [Leptothrix sp. C29]